MNISTVFPAELNPGDEIWDGHPGVSEWVTIEAICSGDQEVLVRCDCDSELIHLPATMMVQAFRASPDRPEKVGSEADLAAWYGGDLRWAAAAVAARDSIGRRSASRAEDCSSQPAPMAFDEGLRDWYPGDIAHVLSATCGCDEDAERARLETARRIQAKHRHEAASSCPTDEEPADSDIADRAVPTVWYHGDLAAAQAAVQQHKSARPASDTRSGG